LIIILDTDKERAQFERTMELHNKYLLQIKKAFLANEKLQTDDDSIPHWESEESVVYIDLNNKAFKKFRLQYKRKLLAKVEHLHKEKNL